MMRSLMTFGLSTMRVISEIEIVAKSKIILVSYSKSNVEDRLLQSGGDVERDLHYYDPTTVSQIKWDDEDIKNHLW